MLVAGKLVLTCVGMLCLVLIVFGVATAVKLLVKADDAPKSGRFIIFFADLLR